LELLISGVKNPLNGGRRAKGNPDATHRGSHLSLKLEQLAANRAQLSIGEFSVGQSLEAQGLHQDIGKGGEPETELIRLKLMGGGAVAKEVELMLLDAIFHLASRAVIVAVEVGGMDLLSVEGGDHKMATGGISNILISLS